MSAEVDSEAIPAKTLLLTSAIQPLQGQSFSLIFKPTDGSKIAANTIILEMTSQLGSQGFPYFRDRKHIPRSPEPLVHFL